MPVIPEFSDGYYLPPGVHVCSLHDIENRFLGSERRKAVWRMFKTFLERLKFLCVVPEVILIDGSFVTGREEPGDVDVCLLIRPESIIRAMNSLDNEEDKLCLEFICNPDNQAALRLSFGTHPLIAYDENNLQLYSDLFRTGGAQFRHLRPSDAIRDPGWVKTPSEKGILRVNFSEGGVYDE